MSNDRTVFFAVKLDINLIQDATVTPCHIMRSGRDHWIVYTLGQNSGKKLNLSKKKFNIFGSLLGAKAHVLAAAQRKIEQLERAIDDWHDVADQHHSPCQTDDHKDPS